MCGINGYALARQDARNEIPLRKMNQALFHRGPDEGGITSTEFAAIGMRRLSVIDVAHGSQPMHAADGRYSIVYNGEIYDQHLIRQALRKPTDSYRTGSDTETILQAYVELGPKAVHQFNGMFAFAVIDREERSLFIARDQLGIKPLFYYHSPQGDLIFSSELNSLVAHPDVPRSIDPEALLLYLTDRFVTDPWTMYAGIRQLPPGHTLRWVNGQIRIDRYDDFSFNAEEMSESEAVGELRSILDETIKSQMVADVPVGVFLSGGIDSSTVAAFAAQSTSQQIKTFSVGFDDAAYDESQVAKAVAEHLNSDHYELRVQNGGFDLDLFDLIIDHVGQPFGDTSCIPTYMVSKFTREHVTVALSGDGGDELFGGYTHMFWGAKIRRVQQRIPHMARKMGYGVLSRMSPMVGGAWGERLRRASKGLATTFTPPHLQLRQLMSLWTDDEARAAIRGGAERLMPQTTMTDPEQMNDLCPEDYIMRTLARTTLPGDMLTKVDRMSMAASLEVRPPLLDKRVVDFARRCPFAWKVKDGVGKHVLREAGRPLLPEIVYSHRKQGFSIPLAKWYNNEFWDLLESLTEPGTATASLFEPGFIRQTIDDGRNAFKSEGRVSNRAASARVWQLAMLARWIDRFSVSVDTADGVRATEGVAA